MFVHVQMLCGRGAASGGQRGKSDGGAYFAEGLVFGLIDLPNAFVCCEFDFLAALFGLLQDCPLGLLDFGADLCQDTAVGFCLWFVLHFPASLKNCKVLFAAAVFRCRGHGFTKRNKVG